jgi:hypothetical protein
MKLNLSSYIGAPSCTKFLITGLEKQRMERVIISVTGLKLAKYDLLFKTLKNQHFSLILQSKNDMIIIFLKKFAAFCTFFASYMY